MKRLPALLVSLVVACATHPAAAEEGDLLPRLAGTVVAPAYRAALFETAGGMSALEPGAALGPWTIEAIHPGRAILTTATLRREIDLQGADQLVPISIAIVEPGRAIHWTNPCSRQRSNTGRNPAAITACHLALQQVFLSASVP